MWMDLTLVLTEELLAREQQSGKTPPAGHLGTHFDVMNQEFPMDYLRREGIVFDVSDVQGRDITAADIRLDVVQSGMFVAFYTGFLDQHGYGTPTYVTNHPQLSDELIGCLLEKGVSVIAIDFAGVRRGKEHVSADQRCAECGCFVIEHVCHLDKVLANGNRFTAYTFPLAVEGLTGLPCRVAAEITLSA